MRRAWWSMVAVILPTSTTCLPELNKTAQLFPEPRMQPATIGRRARMARAALWLATMDLIGNPQGINYWNYSHKTPGCAPANLQRVGGAGLFYCFATN